MIILSHFNYFDLTSNNDPAIILRTGDTRTMEHNQKKRIRERLLEENLSIKKTLEPGQLIEAEIVSISEDCIFLQLDGKSEGQLEAAELVDNKGNMTVREGDKIKAFFYPRKTEQCRFTRACQVFCVNHLRPISGPQIL